MKKIILLITICTLFTGCTLEKENQGLPDCKIKNCQNSLDLSVYKLECTEGDYRCVTAGNAISCIKITRED